MGLKDIQTQIITQGGNVAPAPPVAGAGLAVIGSLAVIDVSVPSAPVASVLNSPVPIVATAQNNACMGLNSSHLAFVLSGAAEPAFVNSLQVVDISNRAVPVLLSTVTPVNAAGVGYRIVFHTVAGVPYMVLVRGQGGAILSSNIMEVFDVTNAATGTPPVSVQTYNISTAFAFAQTDPNAALKVGNTMVVTSLDRIGFYDLSALPVITQIAGFNFADGRTRTLRDLTATHAYCEVRGPGELIIYNITVPALPVLTGSLVLPETFTALSNIDNGKMYGASAALITFYVFNVSNPAAPSLTSTTAVPAFRLFPNARGANNTVYLSENRLFLGLPARLQVWDTTNPAAPALQNSPGTVYSPGTTPSTQEMHTDIVGFIT